ncbi:hypothetical protein CBFG_02154 [Clostridiales bacterium 1_7_47FAA]|nr:hypothetical protein CBFG_02154 [Clostridiales bacterium 1_7_47FAA]
MRRRLLRRLSGFKEALVIFFRVPYNVNICISIEQMNRQYIVQI